jgi:hypothetical protein
MLICVGSYAPAQGLRIQVRATQISSFDTRDPAQLRFGALEFRGGLALTSNDPAFGGISALRMEPDGSHFLALTDNGSWLRARLVYEDGKPTGIADAEMAPMLGSDGKPLATRGWFDTESLAEAEGCSMSALSASRKSCASIIAATVCLRAANRLKCRMTSRPSRSTKASSAWRCRRRTRHSPAN